MIGLEARLIGALCLVTALMFGWNRLKENYREEGRQECRDATAQAYRENLRAFTQLSELARAKEAKNAADALAARSAADRLRGAVAGNGLRIRPAAASGSAAEPVSETERVSAELLRGCVDTARFADCLASGGEACEASYGAVSK